jgi:hypothetical protein
MIRTMTIHNNYSHSVLLTFYKGGKRHPINLRTDGHVKYTFSDKDATLKCSGIDIPLDIKTLMIGHDPQAEYDTITRSGDVAYLNYHPFTLYMDVYAPIHDDGDYQDDDGDSEISFSNWIDIPNSMVELRDVCRDYLLEYGHLLGLSPLRASILSDEYGSHVIRHDIFLHYSDKRHAYNWLMEKLDMPDRCVEITDHKVSIQEGASGGDKVGRGLRRARRSWR